MDVFALCKNLFSHILVSYSALFCGGTISDHDGWIYPPNPVVGDNDYDFMYCEWMIYNTPGYTLQFQIIFLRIEEFESCHYFFLRVRPVIDKYFHSLYIC